MMLGLSARWEILICTFSFLLGSYAEEKEFCREPDEFGGARECGVRSCYSRNRYVLYDVNPPEGFNLRRDVYIRVAVFMRDLQEREKEFKWQLVLPPWGNMYHWRSRNIGSQTQLPWGLFFDIPSLEKYTSVIEMHQFFKEYPAESGESQLDTVYILQNDEDMFKSGKFEDKNEEVECLDNAQYYKLHNGI